MACVDVQGAELGLILCSHNPETPYILNKGLAFSFSPELWHGTLSRQGSVMFLSADGGGPQAADWGLGQNCIPFRSLHHSYLLILLDPSEQSSCPEIPTLIVSLLLISFCS